MVFLRAGHIANPPELGSPLLLGEGTGEGNTGKDG